MATVKTGQINVPYQSRNSFNYVNQVVKTNDYQVKSGEKNPQFWQTVRGGYYAGNVGISDEQRFDSGTFVQTGQNTITVNAVKGHDIAVEFFVNKNIDSVSSYGFNGCSTREKGVLRGTNEIVSSEIDNNVWYAIISTQGAENYTIGESIKVLSLTAGGVGMTVYAIFQSESTAYDGSVLLSDDTPWESVEADPYISQNTQTEITLTLDTSYGEWTDGVVSYSGHFIEVNSDKPVEDAIDILADVVDSQGQSHTGLHYTMNIGESQSKAFYRKNDWIQNQIISGSASINIINDNAKYVIVNNLPSFAVSMSQSSNANSMQHEQMVPITADTSRGEWDDGSDDPSTYDSFDEWYQANDDGSTYIGEDDSSTNSSIIGYSTEYFLQFLNKIYGQGWSIDENGNAKFNSVTVADGGGFDLDGYATVQYSDLMDASLKRYVDNNYASQDWVTEQIQNIDIIINSSDGSVNLSNYATLTYVDQKDSSLLNFVNDQDSSLKSYIDNNFISNSVISGFATTQYVNSQNSSILNYLNNQDSSLKSYIDNQDSSIVQWCLDHTVILSQEEYDQIEEKDPTKIYFIQDGGGGSDSSSSTIVEYDDTSLRNYIDQRDNYVLNYVVENYVQLSNNSFLTSNDISTFVEKTYVDSSVNRLQSLIENNYATRQWVTQQLIDWDSSSQIDLSDYATVQYSDLMDASLKDYIDSSLERYATKQYSDEQDTSLINLMNIQDTSIKNYVDAYKTQNDARVNSIENSLNNDQIVICTEAEYEQLEQSGTVDEEKLYFITT